MNETGSIFLSPSPMLQQFRSLPSLIWIAPHLLSQVWLLSIKSCFTELSYPFFHSFRLIKAPIAFCSQGHSHCFITKKSLCSSRTHLNHSICSIYQDPESLPPCSPQRFQSCTSTFSHCSQWPEKCWRHFCTLHRPSSAPKTCICTSATDTYMPENRSSIASAVPLDYNIRDLFFFFFLTTTTLFLF